VLSPRKHKISRLEEFSDAVFGFALTLLALFAMLFAMLAPVQLALLSPSSFALMGPAHWYYGSRRDKARRALASSTVARPVPQTT
jgi:hypothetical protein